MKTHFAVSAFLAAALVGSHATTGLGQNTGSRVVSRTVASDTQTNDKFTLILFWKENNAATGKMSKDLQEAVAKRADRAVATSVNVSDAANQSLVEQFKVSRAPMPMVLCIAPNGAVTGGIPDKITDDSIEKVLVTPTMTQCMKALQDGKLVLVHVRADGTSALPSGASEFAADAAFRTRTVAVSFRIDDPIEKRFLSEMGINPAAVRGSVVSLLAPPGVLVGKYSPQATKDQIAADLHAAGKCCDDPNCVHNKKGK
jgi:hypothetical protein